MAKGVRAPYNFVSFPKQVLQRYQAIEEVPRQDQWDASLCSGEITITLTAETPVFVSNGNREEPDFFRGADGAYQIPGSSLRGLIRENMQILGLGLVRPDVDMQDITLYYRAMANAEGTLKKKSKDHYKAVLGMKCRQNDRGSALTRVKAGYLYHEKSHNPGETGYYIQPVRGEFVRVPRKIKRRDKGADKVVMNPEVSGWLECPRPFQETVYYWYQGRTLKLSRKKPVTGDAKQGALLCPGFMNSQNHFYLFPEEDEAAKRIPISREALTAYQEDYETRKNMLGGTRDTDTQEEKERKKRFWALPEEGKCKPVFYCINGGMISFSPSSYYLRIAYDRPLRQGLPRSYLECSENKRLFLDYPDAILGFTGTYCVKDQKGLRQERPVSLRSRVSFGDLRANETPETIKAVNIILGEPKLSFFPAYVQEGKDYNQPDFQFRGYKQYWLHDPVKQDAGENQDVKSTLRPLPVGTSFTGTIRYQNLNEDELGLLLWCLRLKEGCYQPIGMGKPYGYGRMKLTINKLREFQPEMLYGLDSIRPADAFFKPVEPLEDRISALINRYHSCEWVKEAGIENLMELPHIREFFTIRSLIAVNSQLVSYMQLNGNNGKEYQNLSDPLGTIEALQAKMQIAATAPAPEPKPAQAPQKSKPHSGPGDGRSHPSCKWQVGDCVKGTVIKFADNHLFVRIQGEKNQSVYFKNIPGGRYGKLEELVGYNRPVTIRLESIHPTYGPQWVIDAL